MKKKLKKTILAAIVIVCFGISNNAIGQVSQVWSASSTLSWSYCTYIGCENMDNDANKEIVYFLQNSQKSSSSIFIVDGTTGAVQWESGNLASSPDAVKLVDVNNNGKYELLIYTSLYAFNGAVKVGNVYESKTTDLNNFPNPFSQATTIKYTIPNRGLVSIKIYDFNGNELKSLVNMLKDSGDYELTFDGSDLPSGTYFYQLVVGDIKQAKKMLIIK